MKKVSVLMAFLITGYILGIWNFLILPKYYLNFGLKGFLLMFVPIAIAFLLIYGEIEATRRTRYLAYEYMVKVSRAPAVIFSLLLFLMIVSGVTLYYTSKTIPAMANVSTSYIAPVIIILAVVAFALLALAKGRALEVISALSVLFIIFTIVAVFVMRSQVHSFVTSPMAMHYLHARESSIFSFSNALTARGTALLLISGLVSFGLGLGVYYVLGSFMPEDVNIKKVLAAVVILQIVLSLAAAMITAYSIGAAYQSYENAQQRYGALHNELIQLYSKLSGKLNRTQVLAVSREITQVEMAINQTNLTKRNFERVNMYATTSYQGPMNSIETFYMIPQILRGGHVKNAGIVIFLLMVSLLLAGFTSFIVMMEVGSQISSEVIGLRRNKSLAMIGIVAAVIALAMTVFSIRLMLVAVPFAVGGIFAAIEAYPVLVGASPVNRKMIAVAFAASIALGIAGLYIVSTAHRLSAKMGVVIGLVLLVPLLLNSVLLQPMRMRR
ncbi:MAG: hypothetical protein GXO14_00950 [Thermococci archaeon]|nr:hypothetical protein [Thermococci archaeon]